MRVAISKRPLNTYKQADNVFSESRTGSQVEKKALRALIEHAKTLDQIQNVHSRASTIDPKRLGRLALEKRIKMCLAAMQAADTGKKLMDIYRKRPPDEPQVEAFLEQMKKKFKPKDLV